MKHLIITIILCTFLPVFSTAQNTQTPQKKINIKDIFLMLPDKAFVEGDLNLKIRRKLLETIGQKPATGDDFKYIDICDLKNGYMSVIYNIEEWKYEICYWNLKDGRKLVAVNKDAGFGDIEFYLYKDGSLKKDSSLAPDIDDKQIEDFFDTSRLNQKEKEKLKDLLENRLVFAHSLPRKGTSIEMYLGWIPFDMDYECIFEDAGLEEKLGYKHVVFKWVDEKWVKEVKSDEGK